MNSNQFSKLFLIVAVLGLSVVGFGQLPGELDQTFFAGRATTKVGGQVSIAAATAIQSDGRIVTANRLRNGAALTFLFAAARYNTDGSLDKTFGTLGTVSISVGGFNDDVANALAIQPDGKILIAGVSYGGANALLAVVRLNTDGSLDPTFDGDGKAFALIGTYSEAQAIAVNNGKIIVAATCHNGSNFDFGVVRFNSNGSLDSTFGAGGKVSTPVGTGHDHVTSAAVYFNGKITVAGYSAHNLGESVAVVRYNQDGSLDTSFDTDGKTTAAIGAGNSNAQAVALTIDGKIVIGGYAADFVDGSYNFALVRFQSNGALDASFDGDGRAMTLFESGGNELIYALTIQPNDGKIVAAGYSANSGDSRRKFALARYNVNGSLDNSFDSDGKATISVNGANDLATAVALQPDGKIVAAGSVYVNNYQSGLVRLNADGSVDNAFGNRVMTDFYAGQDSLAHEVAVQPDGKIVAAGYSFNGTNRDFAVARYHADGLLDRTFGDNGKVLTQIGSSIEEARALAIQPDGKILVGGYSHNGTFTEFALVRYTASGALDNTFGGGDGKVTTPVGTAHSLANQMAIQADGKIVLVGSASQGGSSDFAVARYNSDGSLDASFDTDGIAITPVGSNADEAKAVVIQSDGKIVVGGHGFSSGVNYDFLLARYNTNGSLDSTFDGDGKALTEMGNTNDRLNALAIQSNGKIIAAGYTQNGSNSDFAVARYNADGSLDASFDADGKTTTDFAGGSSDSINAVAVQTDGKIIGGGTTGTGFQTTYDAAFARYNTDGSLDTGFDFSALNLPDEKAYAESSDFVGDGKTVIPIGGGDDTIYDIALQTNGKIVAVGSAVNGANTDFAVLRLNGNPVIPTAATVSVGGRVTDSNGRGIARAMVTLTDSSGNSSQTMTNPFGYYQFPELFAGQTYVFNVRAKRYQFAAQIVTVTENIEDLNFAAFSPQ